VARRALVIGSVFLLVALALVLWRALASRRHVPPPTSFHSEQVVIVSPELALEVVRVLGDTAPGHMRWRCVLRCREAEGCHAQLRVTVHYRSGTESSTITFADIVSVARGEEAVVGGLQRPPRPVDGVDRVEVVVEQRLGAEQPTPVIDM
jgi:hypothetical protein